MKFLTSLLLLLLASTSLASPLPSSSSSSSPSSLFKRHTTMQYIWVNNVDLGSTGRQAVRDPGTNGPVTSVTSADITCNIRNTPVAGLITAHPGDTITTEYHHDNNNRGSQFVDPSHKGPFIVYMAKVANAKTDLGKGSVWFKVYEDGYTHSDRQWATDRLNANGPGKASFKIPSSLPLGDYLLRTEFIALQGAVGVGGAQFYIGCVQMKLEAGGANAGTPVEVPASVKVAFPGYHKADHPGILFRLDGAYTSYTIPGPAVYRG